MSHVGGKYLVCECHHRVCMSWDPELNSIRFVAFFTENIYICSPLSLRINLFQFEGNPLDRSTLYRVFKCFSQWLILTLKRTWQKDCQSLSIGESSCIFPDGKWLLAICFTSIFPELFCTRYTENNALKLEFCLLWWLGQILAILVGK